MENGNKIFKNDIYDLEYNILGEGENLLLVFHGFGQNCNISNLMTSIYKDYTILSVSLFYHDVNCDYNDIDPMKPISVKRFVGLYESLIYSLFDDVSNVSVFGYSIGGRLASVFSQNTQLKINELFLIAPDGYQFSFFYWFVTYTWVGGFLYYQTMKHIYFFKELLSFFKKIKIIPNSMYKFLIISIGLKRNRVLAPKVWQVYKMLIIDRNKLKRKLSVDHSRLEVYLGVYDPVIRFNTVKRKLKTLKPVVFDLKKGHSILSQTFFEKNFKKSLLKVWNN